MEGEFQTEEIAAGGTKIALYQSGQGFPVLLLHGLIAKGAFSLRYLAKKLAEYFWVIAPHLPGYEGSLELEFKSYQRLAQLIVALTRKLGITEFHLFGHSTGGTIALVTASEYPGKIEKLALFEPPFTKENVWLPWRIAAFFTWLPGYVWILQQILTRSGIPDFKGAKAISVKALVQTGKILSKSDFSPICQRVADLKIPILLASGQKNSLLLSNRSLRRVIPILKPTFQLELGGADHTLKRVFQEKLADYLIRFFLGKTA